MEMTENEEKISKATANNYLKKMDLDWSERVQGRGKRKYFVEESEREDVGISKDMEASHMVCSSDSL